MLARVAVVASVSVLDFSSDLLQSDLPGPRDCSRHSETSTVGTADHVLRPGTAIVVSLIYCPEVPSGTRYELTRRESDGSRRSLYCGTLSHPAPSLNLARIRRRGACLGANEVVLSAP